MWGARLCGERTRTQPRGRVGSKRQGAPKHLEAAWGLQGPCGGAVGETEKSGLIGVGACALVVMLQGAVKETPVEATLVRGVP